MWCGFHPCLHEVSTCKWWCFGYGWCKSVQDDHIQGGCSSKLKMSVFQCFRDLYSLFVVWWKSLMIDWLYLSCLARIVRKLICMVNYCHFMKCSSWLSFKDGESKKWFMWINYFCSLQVELCHWCFCVFEAGFCLNSYYMYTQAQKLSNFFKQCTDV